MRSLASRTIDRRGPYHFHHHPAVATIVVSSPGAQAGKTLTPATLQVHATDSLGLPLTYTASGLPTGLSMNSSGLISGTPTAAGTYSVVLTVTDDNGGRGAAVFTWTVTAGSGSNTITVTNPGSQTATAGSAISTLTIAATDSGGATLTYSATGLPAGLSISSATGAITGTPTTAATYTTVVTVTDPTTASGTAAFNWTVNPSSGPPPPVDHVAAFYASKVGFGAGITAGLGAGWTVLTVTNTSDSIATTGSLRWACAQVGKTIIRFAAGLGDIVDPARKGWDCTSDTLLDGWQWTGVLYGFVNNANCDNFLGMYYSITQPFTYGTDPSGAAITGSNCPRAYFYRINGWDTGDVVGASGAYSPQKVPPPYHVTYDSCRIGPNPGEHAIMSTTTPAEAAAGLTRTPGTLNGIDNDPSNGKGFNVAYDHTAVAQGEPFGNYDHAAFTTWVNCVMQGCHLRNGKVRSETGHVINCLIVKYGTPYDLGDPSVSPGVPASKIGLRHGAGAAADDNATLWVEGTVFIGYNNGEQTVGWQDAVADAHGKPHIRVGTLPNGHPDPDGGATANKAIAAEGKAATLAEVFIGPTNYLTGQTVATFAKTPTGNPNTLYYSADARITPVDVHVYADAVARVHVLEDDPDTRAGNPWSTLQPPNWRDVHTGGTFPAS